MSSPLNSLYTELVMEHDKRPLHAGLREPFTAEVHHVNPTCGDEITLRLQLSEDASDIEDVSYDAQGCSISQASASMMAELIMGRPVTESLEVYEAFHTMISSRGQDGGDEEILDDAVALAGVSRYPARVKCALLGWMAYKDALGQITDDTGE